MRVVSIVILFFVVMVSNVAMAAIETVHFKAVVVYIGDQYCQCISDDEMALGDTLVGFYRFDPFVPDADTSMNVGKYYQDVPSEIVIQKDGFVFASQPEAPYIYIEIKNDEGNPLYDSYDLDSWANGPDPLYADSLGYIDLQLWDESGVALNDDSLPEGAPEISDWGYRMVEIFGPDLVWEIEAEIIEFEDSKISGVNVGRTTGLQVSESVPNPFTGVATIRYYLEYDTKVEVDIYDVAGRLVKSFDSLEGSSGLNMVTWDGRSSSGLAMPSGVYFYRVSVGSLQETRKMVLVR